MATRIPDPLKRAVIGAPGAAVPVGCGRTRFTIQSIIAFRRIDVSAEAPQISMVQVIYEHRTRRLAPLQALVCTVSGFFVLGRLPGTRPAGLDLFDGCQG